MKCESPLKAARKGQDLWKMSSFKKTAQMRKCMT